MGQCGCADTSMVRRFPGPDGIIYGLELKPPCTNCGARALVIVTRLRDKDDQWWAEGVPELFTDPAHQEAVIPVLEIETVEKAILAGIQGGEEDDPDSRLFPIKDAKDLGFLLDDHVELSITESMFVEEPFSHAW